MRVAEMTARWAQACRLPSVPLAALLVAGLVRGNTGAGARTATRHVPFALLSDPLGAASAPQSGL